MRCSGEEMYLSGYSPRRRGRRSIPRVGTFMPRASTASLRSSYTYHSRRRSCAPTAPHLRLPAPRISRSRMAILIPEPNCAKSRIALRRFSATSVSTLSRRKVRYAEALRVERPTRPRIWCSWARPSFVGVPIMKRVHIRCGVHARLDDRGKSTCTSPETTRSIRSRDYRLSICP